MVVESRDSKILEFFDGRIFLFLAAAVRYSPHLSAPCLANRIQDFLICLFLICQAPIAQSLAFVFWRLLHLFALILLSSGEGLDDFFYFFLLSIVLVDLAVEFGVGGEPVGWDAVLLPVELDQQIGEFHHSLRIVAPQLQLHVSSFHFQAFTFCYKLLQLALLDRFFGGPELLLDNFVFS